jgi:thiosulfate dehydrogenase (quinone) large subunit
MPARDRRSSRRDYGPNAARPGGSSGGRAGDERQWEPVPATEPVSPTPPRSGARRSDHPPAEPRFGLTMAESTVMTRALLPLRLFLGGTFLYAGIDKIIDPTFLRATGPGSIGEQLAAFERVSPIAGLVHLADPFPVLVGLLIALLEIAVGVGTLLGLLFRWSAFFGAALSFLFFLTASWGTHPYYYGPDLPYMLGWITLTLAGHGHLYTLEDWLAARDARAAASVAAWPPRGVVRGRPGATTPPMFTDRERRAFLQLGILAVASIAVASLTGMWSLRQRAESGGGLIGDVPGGSGSSTPPSAGASTSPSAMASAAPSASAGASSAPQASPANLIGTMSDLRSQGALMFQDPSSGDPVIVVDAKGSVVAYDAVCTHQGCTVEYDPNAVLLFCPCHGAEFDPTRGAQVVAGPARRPLAQFPLTIDSSTGRIYLKA